MKVTRNNSKRIINVTINNNKFTTGKLSIQEFDDFQLNTENDWKKLHFLKLKK